MSKKIQSLVAKTFQLPYFPLVVAPLILFSPTIFSGKALFWGTPSLQFIPWWDFAWETLMNGHLPLWNPMVGMGAPLAANYQSALFYPPYWIHFGLYAIGGLKLMAWGITIVVVIHLAWAGIGMAKLMQELGINKLGQTVAGLAFSLSGYLISRAGFLSINATVVWLPWIMLFSRQLALKKTNSLLWTGITTGMMLLAGHAQTSWYVISLAGIWVIFWAIKSSRKSSIFITSLDAATRFVFSGFIGFGISAIQLIPTFEYLLNSSRSAEYGFSEAMTYSFWPWRIFTLFVPGLFGNPAYGNYWGYGNYWEDALYIGVFPIALAFGLTLELLFFRKKSKNEENDHKELIAFLIVIIFIGFLFALGKNTPVFPFLYRHIPTFNLFQAPTRFAIWVEFSLVLLVGIGINELTPPHGKRLYWNRLAVAGCAAAFSASILAWFFLREIKTTFILSIGIASLWGLGTSIFFLKQPEQKDARKHQIWKILLIVFIGLDLLVAGWGLNPSINMDFYNVRKSTDSDSRYLISAADEYDLKFERFFKFDTYEAELDWEKIFDLMLPNIAMLRGVEMVNNFDPIIPSRYDIWMREINSIDWFGKNGSFVHQVFDLMAVGSTINANPDGSYDLMHTQNLPMEHIKLYTCAEYINDEDEILELILSETIKTSKTILLENGGPGSINNCLENTEGQYKIEAEAPGYLKLIVDLPDDGWVFWSQSWYPGWKIKVDGKKGGDALKANYLFQAAEVTTGKHLVEFYYSPKSFIVGAVITSLSVIFILVSELIRKYRA